jgi:hypothetical protein
MSSSGLTPGEETQLDKQISYLAGFALVALVICVVLLFVFSTSVAAFGPALSAEITTIANSISGQVVGAVNQLEQAARTVQSLATDAYNKTTTAVNDGVTNVVNIILSVGNGVLTAIVSGTESVLNLLAEMSSDTFVFFENIFQPLVTLIGIIGQVVIDGIAILTSMLAPILTIINDFVLSIEAIGKVFPWG